MDLLRKGFDLFYDYLKYFIFSATKNNPETAHPMFVKFYKTLDKLNLGKIVLDNSSNNNSKVSYIKNGNFQGLYSRIIEAVRGWFNK